MPATKGFIVAESVMSSVYPFVGFTVIVVLVDVYGAPLIVSSCIEFEFESSKDASSTCTVVVAYLLVLLNELQANTNSLSAIMFDITSVLLLPISLSPLQSPATSPIGSPTSFITPASVSPTCVQTSHPESALYWLTLLNML